MKKVARSKESMGAYLKRSLKGTTFLGLEHAMHMVFLVVVSGLVSMGAVAGLKLWMGQTGVVNNVVLDSVANFSSNVGAIMIVAALAVLAPFLIILDRRTRAEWVKRPGFSSRLAYKAPIYVALGVTWAIKLSAIVTLVFVLLNSLALVGKAGGSTTIASMYSEQFVPALIALLIFGALGWHLIRLAQGRDFGQKFNLALAVIAGLLAVSLYAGSVVSLRSSQPVDLTPERSLDDYLQEYNSDSYLRDLYKQ